MAVVAYALGIDVGTTFTAAAIWEAGRATVLSLAQRSDAVPSVVYLGDNGRWLVGESAERRALTEPNRVARGFKRRLGDPVDIWLAETFVSPVRLTTEVVRWVLAAAVERQGGPPTEVVVTVPAHWGNYRRNLMRDAAGAAGQYSLRLEAEPVAAAVYYGASGHMSVGATVGVFDLGGGTFDCALVRRTADGYQIVGDPAGDPATGGLDLDDLILAHVQDVLAPAWAQTDLSTADAMAGLVALRQQVSLGREALSDDVDAAIPVILPGLTGTVRLTRPELEAMASDVVERAVSTFARMLTRERIESAGLAAILLVGGTSRMPLVSVRLTSRLGRPVVLDAHPKYAVCLGAAMLAAAPATSTPDPAGPASVDGAPVASAARVLLERRAPEPSPRFVTVRPAGLGVPGPAAPTRGRSRISMTADLAEAGLVPTLSTRSAGSGVGNAQGSLAQAPLVVRSVTPRHARAAPLLLALLAAAAVAALILLLGR